MTHVSQFLFASSVERVLADLHQLPEKNLPDLGEASAGGLHQGLQDGADVGLDAGPQELLRLGQHQSCTPEETHEEKTKQKRTYSQILQHVNNDDESVKA